MADSNPIFIISVYAVMLERLPKSLKVVYAYPIGCTHHLIWNLLVGNSECLRVPTIENSKPDS